MKRRDTYFLIFSLLIAGIVGGLLGDIIGHYLPEGAVRTILLKNIEIGFDATDFDFYVVGFTFGFHFSINFMSVLFMILVLIYFRWWYI